MYLYLCGIVTRWQWPRTLGLGRGVSTVPTYLRTAMIRLNGELYCGTKL